LAAAQTGYAVLPRLAGGFRDRFDRFADWHSRRISAWIRKRLFSIVVARRNRHSTRVLMPAEAPALARRRSLLHSRQ
jgi:hypothetical protein